MYVLFAVLASLVIYAGLLAALRSAPRAPERPRRLVPATVLLLGLSLVVFNVTSRAVGIDLGPGYVVSYDIPSDYLARGALGTVALLPYALACFSPALAYALLRRD